jgi:hypothetical protein
MGDNQIFLPAMGNPVIYSWFSQFFPAIDFRLKGISHGGPGPGPPWNFSVIASTWSGGHSESGRVCGWFWCQTFCTSYTYKCIYNHIYILLYTFKYMVHLIYIYTRIIWYVYIHYTYVHVYILILYIYTHTQHIPTLMFMGSNSNVRSCFHGLL